MGKDRTALGTLLRARHPCIAIVADDETHLMEELIGATIDHGRTVLTWSAVRGISAGMWFEELDARPDTQQPVKALKQLQREPHHSIFVLNDLGDHLQDPVTVRALRELIAHCRKVRATVVLVDHRAQLPEPIAREAVSYTASLPDADELGALVKDTLHRLKADDPLIGVRISHAAFTALVRNLRGLTRSQAAQVVADAAVADGSFDDQDVQFVLTRKRQVLRGEGLLEAIDTPVTLAEVAGIEGLQEWLRLREQALGGEIPGVPPPHGVLLLGVPGTGKSLCAKAIATAWGRPLFRLDAGVLYDKYVGESESRLRDALRQAEAMAPTVLWVDEIEKAFASAASHSTDGGLSQRMFGSLLTWMQERTAAVFTVATANDIAALPPELLRKGRFDEIFFLDLPTASVRQELFRIHLAKRQQDPAAIDLAALAAQAEGFSGAEIEAVIINALLEAHQRHQPLDTAALQKVIAATTPLAVTMDSRIAELRAWAAGRCRPAGGSPLGASPAAAINAVQGPR